jgi:plasmid stability protein
MATVTVKNLPAELHQRLKGRAARHRRSLNSEIIECLREASMSTRIDPEALLAKARALRPKVSSRLNERRLREFKDRGRR